MDADRKELVRRLFVSATEIVEAAHEVASDGQSARHRREAYVALARRLRWCADDLGAMAGAMIVIARAKTNQADENSDGGGNRDDRPDKGGHIARHKQRDRKH